MTLLLAARVVRPAVILVASTASAPGMWLVGIGILMNFTVIVANGGMPVLSEAAYVAGGTNVDADIIASAKHVLLDTSTVLPFLGDVIPSGCSGTARSSRSATCSSLSVSHGSSSTNLRQPVRWFKHGARTEAGSAARR